MQNPHNTTGSPNNLEFRVLAEAKPNSLLLQLLELTIQLHQLDQGDQPSENVERQLERVYKQLLPAIQVDVPHRVIREERVYHVWVNADGVTFQAELVVNDSLEATA